MAMVPAHPEHMLRASPRRAYSSGEHSFIRKFHHDPRGTNMRGMHDAIYAMQKRYRFFFQKTRCRPDGMVRNERDLVMDLRAHGRHGALRDMQPMGVTGYGRESQEARSRQQIESTQPP